MKDIKYEGCTATFLLAMQSLNIRVQLTGVTWRAEIEKKMPFPILEHILAEDYDLDSDWIKALETVGKRYENFLRDQKLNSKKPSRKDFLKRKSSEGDRQFDKKKQKVYTKAEKEAYKASKQSPKGKTCEGKKKHSEYELRHKGIPETLIADRRKNRGCTRCGLTNHRWKNCRKEAQVMVVRRAPWIAGKG